MKLLLFRTPEGPALGIRTASGVLDVREAAAALNWDVPVTPDAVFAEGLDALPALASLVEEAMPRAHGAPWILDEAGLRLGPCVHNPEKILCVGLNYRRHAAESGAKVPEVPVLFSKFNNALAAHDEAIPLSKHAKEYDYEVELAVVIGRTAQDVPVDQALNYVLGYCNANDISARDLQMRTPQWLLGKTMDKFCPIGPYLVTADEVGDPQTLTTRSWLNGELRQNSSTADMVFSVAEIISYFSRYMTLRSGDVILTGTPEGVILGMRDKVWMKPGDTISIEVSGLGMLTNPLVVQD
ncbi:MAG: fumarylacetoacetate hydrolase family protein [Anaerolineae bacterium]|jgi:2-keto-4-pentenoate hydratase/2-oxohepta-3-ene-1,7-dioic acid hydratase in catechol pathway|nr:fumarylacetoacetate hydrolase family protein [Anaerolineae bacterium]